MGQESFINNNSIRTESVNREVTQLRMLQLAQLEILYVIDELCKEEDIRYSLYAGTLLGAVRHKGFIPWDDDLDICMERSEYNRFIAAWNQRKPAGYLLQNKENSRFFPSSFTKIRKEKTTFLQTDWEVGKIHTGIFVDVFPIDRLPDGVLGRVVFRWKSLVYLLLTREYVPPKGNLFERGLSYFILALIPSKHRMKVRAKLLTGITKHSSNRTSKLQCVAIETVKTIFTALPSDLFDDYVFLPFESGSFMCFFKWKEYLQVKFGDYMTLPPMSERTWKHHPVILDFEHDYEEIIQKGLLP